VVALAQCPRPVPCIPSPALSSNLVFGCGIGQVVFNTINRTSGLASQGFQDVSCTERTSLFVGVPYTITIVTGSNVPENVRVWIDLDNDGSFNATGELVFSSNAQFTHTGSITLPISSVTDTTLRMRVLAEVSGAPDAPASALNPCYSPKYSQVEDYGVTALPNTQPPVTLFTVNDSVTCSGSVQFTDQSLNAPTSWNWSFGDGNTSSLQNPLHTYLPGGPFTVRLITSNAGGSDTLTKNNYITFNTQFPPPAQCTPITNNFCCGYGITNVTLGSINRSSANASEGYRDFTCRSSTTLTQGIPVPISITTGGTLPHDTRVWIDYNNNGNFSANELVFTRLNQVSPSGTIVLNDSSIVLNTPLRMRVISDFTASLYTSCSGVVHGQAEDYTVIVQPNLSPPVAQFSVNAKNACTPTFTFINQSFNTITSYLWRFGDGNTSTAVNPVHTYASPGTYTVTLIVSGPTGIDSLVELNLIKFIGNPVTAACSPTTGSSTGGVGIYRVRFQSIDKSSPGATEGYQNFICTENAEVTEGLTYPFTINTGPNFVENIRIWIDFNNDGQFNTAEIVYTAPSAALIHTGNIAIPSSAVKNALLRMRIISSFNSITTANACGSITFGQAEDYGVVVRSSAIPPTPNFFTTDLSPCNGGVRFTNSSTGIITQYLWRFGDGDSSFLANPVKYYTSPGIYTVSLQACNTFGCNNLVRTNYINISAITGPQYAICFPNTTYLCCDAGMDTVIIGNMISNTGNASEGNLDFSCTRLVTDTAGRAIPFRIVSTQPVGSGGGENVAIWIDLNDDGVFEPVAERVFQGTNQRVFTGTFTVTGSVVLNKPLRLRVVSAAAGFGGTPSTCGTINNAQSEDYAILFRPNTQPPIASFNSAVPSTCLGVVNLTNTSSRNPSTSFWRFGDGNTSTLVSPTHTYAASGTYTVTLLVCNSNGCDSTTRQVIINAVDGPILPSCRPQTLNTCCNIGLTSVRVGSFVFASANATEGYQDRTCLSTFPSLSLGSVVACTLTVGSTNQEKVSIWIDFNDNGSLETTERVFNAIGVGNIIGSFQLNQTAVINKKLRMRVGSDFNDGFPLDPCSNTNLGQFEDYAIVLLPVTSPPVANFTVNNAVTCNGVFAFTNTSTNLPTSFLWNFGNGGTSTLANPVFTYSTPGTYTVSLRVCNSIGCDSIVKTNFVRFASSCPPVYCGTTGHNNTLRTISSFSIGSFTNISGREPNGYGDYSVSLVELVRGNTYPITVFTEGPAAQQSVLEIWIDYNRNGVFANDEKVITRNGTTVFAGQITVPATVNVGEARIRVRFKDLPATTNPCSNLLASAEVEDYAVLFRSVSQAPDASFSVSKKFACPGDTVGFINTTQFIPATYQWRLGNNQTSTLENPRTTYNNPGAYTVTLRATQSFGVDSVSVPSAVTVTNVNTPPTAFSCTPLVTSHCCGIGVRGVTFSNLNYAVSQPEPRFMDMTCFGMADVFPDSSYILNVQLDTVYFQNVAAWIDFNNDGIFSISERVLNRQNVRGLQSTTVTVPSSSTVASLRMRVVSDQLSVFSANGCGTVNLGNALDFTVRRGLITGLEEFGNMGLTTLQVYPNPAKSYVDVAVGADSKPQSWQLLDITGKLLMGGDWTGSYNDVQRLDLTALSIGTYLVVVRSQHSILRQKLTIE
jgi:PKD repeat protein